MRRSLAIVVTAALAACAGVQGSPSEEASAPTPRSPLSTTPRAVCLHLIELEPQLDSTEAEPRSDLVDRCSANVTRDAALRGSDNWAAFADCVLAAESSEEVARCEANHPLPLSRP